MKVFLIINVIVSTILTAIRFHINTGKVIDTFVNVLYGIHGRADWTPRELLECKLTQVRYFKMKKQFDKALSITDEVIREDAEFPDALFLKAKILWEGFGDVEAAKTYLKKVMKVALDEKDCVHRWASNLYDELSKNK